MCQQFAATAQHRPTTRPLVLLLAAALAELPLVATFASPPVADASLFDRLDADKNGTLVAAELPADQQRFFARLLRKGDSDGNESLTREEFAAALVPTRPEKPIEEKQPATFPQANAVRWLLLTLDSNGNARIERMEIDEKFQGVYTALLERIDTNKNDTLETVELTRGGRPLAQIAGRYVQQNRIDVAAELRRLEERDGAAANRFEAQPPRLEDLVDPEKARQFFRRLDANNDGQLEMNEVPDPLQRPLQRLFRAADRDRDERLSEREFTVGARRIAGRPARPNQQPKSPSAKPTAEK